LAGLIPSGKTKELRGVMENQDETFGIRTLAEAAATSTVFGGRR
jgi:hypothetical protein